MQQNGRQAKFLKTVRYLNYTIYVINDLYGVIMAKRKKTKTGKQMIDKQVSRLSRDVKVEDKRLYKAGIDHKTIGGAIITIIGVVLVVFNLQAALLAFVGFVLIYFGLRLLGYNIKI